MLFQYPPWFGPRRENRAELEALRERLPDYRICVEFRSPRWLAEERDRERTLRLLEEHGLVFVCVDAPEVSGLPRLLAITSEDLLVVRFHGRSDRTWSDTSRSAAERFRYLYKKRELEELARPIAELTRGGARDPPADEQLLPRLRRPQRRPAAGPARALRARGAAVTIEHGIARGDDGVARCWWADSAPEYRAYHDREWGFPVADDRRLFEKLSLEGFQAGLSWLTILRKREAFRAAFAGFDYARVARFGPRDVERMLGDAAIVRHRGKIEAVINNARRAVELVGEEGSLARYVWRFEPESPRTSVQVAHTSESRALARELKQRGWRFVGPTTVYAFMQAMGLVNDHLEGCDLRAPAERARAEFERP